ncbi:MAG: ferredoxin [bacterium]|nr:ferredoxin [bacterium]
MMRIFFHRSKCIGCNACVETDKSRWRVSRKDGKCNLVGATEKKGIYRADVEDDESESLLKASKTCPVKIIKFEKLN